MRYPEPSDVEILESIFTVASFANRKAARYTGRLKPLFYPTPNVRTNQVADVAIYQSSKTINIARITRAFFHEINKLTS